MSNEEVRERILSALKNSSLNQTQVAESMGLTQSAFNRTLHGKGPNKLDFITKVAEALNIPPNDLICGADKKTYETEKGIKETRSNQLHESKSKEDYEEREKLKQLEKINLELTNENRILNQEIKELYKKYTELLEGNK